MWIVILGNLLHDIVLLLLCVQVSLCCCCDFSDGEGFRGFRATWCRSFLLRAASPLLWGAGLWLVDLVFLVLLAVLLSRGLPWWVGHVLGEAFPSMFDLDGFC